MSVTKETISSTATRSASRLHAAGGGRTEDVSRPQPVCIEVPVKVQGVRPAADPDKREPFTESTRTVIVFANGAVVRSGTAVNPGQLIFLTNEHTKKEVVCQVVKSKAYQHVAGYLELEFTEPNPGFWGIHFPGDRSESQSSREVPGASQSSPKPQPFPSPPPQGLPAAPPRPNAAPPLASAGPESPAVHTAPLRKEPARAEEKPSPVAPLSAHPELIRPASAPRASVSEPLVFSGTKKTVAPAASVAEPHGDEYAAPSFGDRLLFEDEAETQSAEAKPRRLPAGTLIAAGLVLAIAGGGWYWWRSSRHLSAANLSPRPENAAALATEPPATSTEAPPVVSSPAPDGSKGVEAFTHPSAPAPMQTQPVNASLPSREESRPVEKPAESRGSAAKADKKPALSGFRLSAPSATHRTLAPRNPDPVPGVDAGLAVPGAASPEEMSGLVGSASLQPAAPKPDPPAGGELKPAHLVSSTPPVYPPLARSQRVEGDVTVDALIDATGRVTTIKVISGPVLLQQSAVTAVRQWKYEPAALNGNVVPMHLTVTVKFRLR